MREYDVDFLRRNPRIIEENILNGFRRAVEGKLVPTIVFRRTTSGLGVVELDERELDRLLDKLDPLKYPRLYICLLKTKYGVKELEYGSHRRIERFFEATSLGWITGVFEKVSITTSIKRKEGAFLIKVRARKAMPSYLAKEYQRILAEDSSDNISRLESVFEKLAKSKFVSPLRAIIIYSFIWGGRLDHVEYKYSFNDVIVRNGVIEGNSRSLDSINKRLRTLTYTLVSSIIDPYILLGIMGCRIHYFGRVSYRVEGFGNVSELVEMGGGVFDNENKCPIKASVVRDVFTGKTLLRLQTPLSLNSFLALAPREIIENIIDLEEICGGKSPPENWHYKPSTIYRFYDNALNAIRDSVNYAGVFENIREIYFRRHVGIEDVKKNIINSSLYPALTYLLDCDIGVIEYLLFGKRYYKPRSPEGLLKSFVKALEYYFLGGCLHRKCYYSKNVDNLTLAMRLLVNYIRILVPLRAVLFEEDVPQILLLPLRHGPRHVLKQLVDEAGVDMLDYNLVLHGQRIPVTQEFIQYILRLSKSLIFLGEDQ